MAEGPYRLGADLLAYIRMPLFTFLSGYVYAWRPFSNDIFPFLTGKARRLLIPMVVVGSLFVLTRMVTPGTNHSTVTWYMLHIYPVEHFWFVESLFIVFLLVIPLEWFGILRNRYAFAGLFALVAVVYVSGVEFPENYFSVNGTFYLLPFFLAGLACSRFDLQLGRLYYPLLVAGLVVPYVYIFMEIQGADWVLARRTLLALWIGVTSSVLLVRSGIRFGPLAQIGAYSYAIYLFHVFFTAAARIVLTTIGIMQPSLLLLLCTAAGLVGPIILELIASQYAWSSVLLLGKKLKRHKAVPTAESSQPLFDQVTPQSQPVTE